MRTTTLLALLVLAGCQAPLTEVMVVVDSNLSAPTTVDFIQVSVDDTTFGTPLERFPASLGIVSQGMKGAFSFQVGLSRSRRSRQSSAPGRRPAFGSSTARR